MLALINEIKFNSNDIRIGISLIVGCNLQHYNNE